MIFDEAPTLYRLYWRAAGSHPTAWWYRDFGNPDERFDYLQEIRQAISTYAEDEGEEIADPKMVGTGVRLPAGLEIKQA